MDGKPLYVAYHTLHVFDAVYSFFLLAKPCELAMGHPVPGVNGAGSCETYICSELLQKRL